MSADFSEIQNKARDLMSAHSLRNQDYEEYERMYFMDDDETKKISKENLNAKITLSPDARNSITGAVRLMVATDPQFVIPKDENATAGEGTDDLEAFAQQVWGAAGRIAGIPIHYDAILSALLYGQLDIGINSTMDLAARAEKQSKARAKRAARAASRTPFVFNVYNPKGCYQEWDQLGLTAHYRRWQTTFGSVQDEYGSLVQEESFSRADTVFLNDWWDLDNHVVWIDDKNAPIINKQHGKPNIPIVSTITEGSRSLFYKIEQQAQPFLYTFAKSNLWQRQNLALSVMYTLVFGMGANPLYVYKTNEPDKQLDIDWTQPGGVAIIEANESLEPMVKNIIDSSMKEILEIAEQKGIESTIYRQTLGEPLGGNAPYSMVSLLNQAGRLPLISPQRRVGWALGKVMEVVFDEIKELDEEEVESKYMGIKTSIAKQDIPDDLEIEAMLEISLPTDRLQDANVAKMLNEGEDPIVSQEWILENIMHIQQPSKMKRQVMKERLLMMKIMQHLEQMMMEQQQQQAIALQEAQAAAQPPAQAPEEQTTELPPQPGQAGIPPEMAQGGQQGPLPVQGMPPQSGQMQIR